MRRYDNTSIFSGGTRYGTSNATHAIRLAMTSGLIKHKEIIITESQRLDILAGIEYGDSTLWWIIAAASNIGWGLQVPPGTLIKIPSLESLRKIM